MLLPLPSISSSKVTFRSKEGSTVKMSMKVPEAIQLPFVLI